jgi:hypothetical protein
MIEILFIVLLLHKGIPSGRIGEEVKGETPVVLISVEVNSWQVNSSITYPHLPSGRLSTVFPREGYKFIVLNMTGKNYGPGEMPYELSMKLKTDKGCIYEDHEAYSETNLCNPTRFTMNAVSPNELANGIRAFEIPKDSNPSELAIYIKGDIETKILLIIDFQG